jgi:hypothetical protein
MFPLNNLSDDQKLVLNISDCSQTNCPNENSNKLLNENDYSGTLVNSDLDICKSSFISSQKVISISNRKLSESSSSSNASLDSLPKYHNQNIPVINTYAQRNLVPQDLLSKDEIGVRKCGQEKNQEKNGTLPSSLLFDIRNISISYCGLDLSQEKNQDIDTKPDHIIFNDESSNEKYRLKIYTNEYPKFHIKENVSASIDENDESFAGYR